MSKLTILERGWAGHFIGSLNCGYHRNTLITFGRKKIVVSTVGAYRPRPEQRMEIIGYNRYYETMAFWAAEENGYIEAEVSREIDFSGEWGIMAESVKELSPTVDMEADKMHERIVAQLSKVIQEDKESL